MAEGVNVRLPGKLKKFIAKQSGPDGVYENASNSRCPLHPPSIRGTGIIVS